MFKKNITGDFEKIGEIYFPKLSAAITFNYSETVQPTFTDLLEAVSWVHKRAMMLTESETDIVEADVSDLQWNKVENKSLEETETYCDSIHQQTCLG